MSQFSTMTTRERKMQAAAICREVQAQEGGELDLGKKVSMPKDIMLDELSFASNRGSLLFEKRKRRNEKFTYESIQNETNKPFNNPMLSPMENGSAAEDAENNSGVDQPPNVPSDSTDTKVEPNPDLIAPGYGGPLKDIPPEKFNSTAVPKSYHSPWATAIINNPDVADTLITSLPEPEARPELPGYKSFNRVATPFGGFNKGAARPAPIKPLDLEPLPDYPELQADNQASRPSFNRAALGWTFSGPVSIPGVSTETVLIPESDDL